jgi:tetratricopeptide (TPR) repeat protein
MEDPEHKGLGDRVAALSQRVGEVGDAAERAEVSTANLARSLEELLARHRQVDRALNLNSFVAYALFTLLLGGAFFVLYRVRAADLAGQRDRATAARDAAVDRADGATAELGRRDRAAAGALEVWRLHQDHRYADAVAAQAKLDPAALGPIEREMFAEALERAHVALAEVALADGKGAAKAGDLPRAIARLGEGLGHVEKGPLANQLRYARGDALARAGKVDEAEAELTAVLAAGAEGQGLVEARFALAALYDRAGRIEDARREYRAFNNRSPAHPLARRARERLSWLALAADRAQLAAARAARAAARAPATPGVAPARSTPPAGAPRPAPATR